MYRSGCWLVRRVVRESGVAVVEQSVTASRYVDCVIPCKSVEVEERLGPCWAPSRADVSDGSEGFVVSKPCGRTDGNEGFVGSKPCGRSDGNEGFVGSKPCGRSDGKEGFVGSKPCGHIGRERRLCRIKAVRTSGLVRRLCRVKAVRTIGREWRLCRGKAERTSVKSEGFAVSKLCERADRPWGQG